MVFQGTENETLSGQARGMKRKSSHRRSSILKVSKSPSRGALCDLDPNSQKKSDDDDNTRKIKSRRVSFADTYQVKEFVKDTAFLQSSALQKQDADQAGQSNENDAVPSGLDFLLTGQIKNDIPLDTTSLESVYEHPLPNVSNESLDHVTGLHNQTTHVSITMDMTQCYGKIMAENESFLHEPIGDDFGEKGMSPEEKIDASGFLKTLMTGSQPSLASKLFVPEKTFSPQKMYHGVYDIDNESDVKTVLNTSLNKYQSPLSEGLEHREYVSSQPDQTQLFQSGNMGDMDFTVCHGGIQASGKEWVEESPVVRKVDSGDFLNQLKGGGLGGGPKTTFVDKKSEKDKTQIFNNQEIPGEDMDFTACVGGPLAESEPLKSQENTVAVDSATCQNTYNFPDFKQIEESPVLRTIDSKDFLSQIQGRGLVTMKTSSARKRHHLLEEAHDSDKTQIFSDKDEVGEDMDFTACMTDPSLGLQGPVKTETFSQLAAGRDIKASVTGTKQLLSGKDAQGHDKTNLFSHTDTEAYMDFTTCIGSTGVGLMCKEVQAEKTKIFNQDKTGADMEFTTCIDNASPGLIANETQAEKTKIFNQDKTAADMEFTTCINSTGLGLAATETQAEKTKIFNQDKTGADMEFTTCINNASPGLIATETQAEKTKIFNQDKTGADMEFTTCINSTGLGLAANEAHAEKTKIFNEDKTGADMEFATCINSTGLGLAANETKAEKTKIVAQSKLGEDMEFTACIGGPSIALKAQETEAERTEIFSHNKTLGDMEFTTCIGSSSMGVPSEEVGLESTTIFSHAKTGADMEFTTCVGSLSLGLNSVQGQKTASNQSKMDENFSVNTSPGKRAAVKTTEPTDAHRHETDKTIHFSSTGEEDMEMTVVTGLVLPGRESKEIEGTVTSGSAEENSEMEFTVSVEELKGSFATKPSAPSADDKTVVFDPNSNPEGDYEDDDDSISFKTTNSMADATKHTTKGMDFTTCVGNIEVNSPPCKTTQSPDCNSSSEEADRMPTTMDNKSDATIVINSNCQLTNNMDFTTCIGEVDSPAPEGLEADSHTKFNPLAEQTGCVELTSCVGNKSSQGLEQDDGQKEPAEKSMSHRDNVNKSNVSQREQLEGQSYTSPSHPQREMSSREFSSDGSSTRGTCSVQGEIEARSRSVTPTDGQGGTYTIQKLCTMGDVLTEHSEPASKPPTSSTSEFGILEESIPDMDHTEEMQNTVSENALSFSKSSYSSGSDTEQLQMTLSKTSMLSVIDEKAEQSMAVSSVDGKITVEDLMMMCGVTFCTKSTRRSTMAPVSMAPPESLQEYLELGMIVQPELETMDWACNWLTQHIEKLRSTVAQVEERLNKNNPEIFEEVRVASKEEMKELKSKIRALVLACRKNSKAKFKQWKGKAVKTILEALQEEEDSIHSCLSELEEACTSLDEQRVKLNEVDAYITEQLRASENLQLPDEQDIQQYVDIVGNLNVEKQVLEEKQMEVNEITKKKDALELEYDVMHKELGRIRLEKKEMMVPCSTSEDLLAKSQCLDRMQRLNEWIIEDIDDYRAKFSWLYDSLLMTVNYGTKTCDPVTGGSTEHRNIADVQFTSKLGDDVACYAHLAHAMILRTIRDEELIKTFPTTEHLPQMMRSVSEVVTGARILSAEVERIQLTHVVKVAETSVTIEFSHLDAFCKFVLTFHLKPGEYPYTPVEWNFKHCIGDIRQEEVSQIIGNQKLGIGYLSRAVDALDKFLDQRVSRKTDNFD